MPNIWLCTINWKIIFYMTLYFKACMILVKIICMQNFPRKCTLHLHWDLRYFAGRLTLIANHNHFSESEWMFASQLNVKCLKPPPTIFDLRPYANAFNYWVYVDFSTHAHSRNRLCSWKSTFHYISELAESELALSLT